MRARLPEGCSHEYSKEGGEGEADCIVGGVTPVRDGVLL